MSVVELAQDIASVAHEGQQYTIGNEPLSYFEAHLVPVAGLVRELGYGEKSIAAAFLHDIIEDTSVTEEVLHDKGIPDDVIEAVVAVSDNRGESHKDYIARVCEVKRAIVVKYSDSTMNLRTAVSTKEMLEPARLEKFMAKYTYNLSILRPLLPTVVELPD